MTLTKVSGLQRQKSLEQYRGNCFVYIVNSIVYFSVESNIEREIIKI